MNTQLSPLYLCMHMPEFPTQARLRYRPQDALKAVVILDGVAPLEQVCSATRKAMQSGITYGATRVELDGFEDVVVMLRSPAEERAARTALIDLAGVFTPKVQVVADTATACALVLDMSGMERMFGSPQQIMLRLRHALQALGMHARMAMSCNFCTAVCAAAYAGNHGTVVVQGEERAALHRLPLAALSLSEQQANTLHMWGLHTCGDLAALPETGLVARMGQSGKALRLHARGEHTHFLVPEEETLLLEEYMALEAPVELLDSLLFVLGPMLDQLLTRAASRSVALASVTLKLALDGAVPTDSPDGACAASEYVRTVKPALPMMDRDLLLKLIHLDMQAHPPSASITAVHLKAEPGDRTKVQMGLFNPELPEPTRLDITLARIAALVGEEHVGRACVQQTHQPDSYVMERYVSLTGLRALPEIRQQSSFALRRMRPPVPLRVRINNGRPAAFSLEGREYVVGAACGPWRLSGNWWSQAIWSRDEWDVRAATHEGQTLLVVLVLDLLQSEWRLEALYD